MTLQDKIVVIDFGGQYTQLIARRVREANVYSEVLRCDKATPEAVADAKGIILSGGPACVTAEDAPLYDPAILWTGKPTLGICYGFQLMAHALGGSVKKGERGEYGKTTVYCRSSALFDGLDAKLTVWMSHGDLVERVPEDFRCIALTENNIAAAMHYPEKKLYGVQFHPEVTHTPQGTEILKNFVHKIAGCEPTWSLENHIESSFDYLDQTIKGRDVIMFVSGGVDSTVAATLLTKAKQQGRNIGNVYLVHVDNGLMRTNESAQVVEYLKKLPGLDEIIFEDASQQFLENLKGVIAPEQKRKVIGDTFIDIQRSIVKRLGLSESTMLCQGTLYTDLIESGQGVGNKAAVIKSHHNVNSPFVKEYREKGLLVEPNRLIFKDEVRKVGELLGLPEEVVWRQPFPGPGLAIRIVTGEVTPERIALLRQADDIFLEEVAKAGLAKQIWQYFAALLAGTKTVGVMGDERTEQYACALRAVTSADGMTADWFRMPHDVLDKVTRRIICEVKGINRVLYDCGSKPPETIEFE